LGAIVGVIVQHAHMISIISAKSGIQLGTRLRADERYQLLRLER